MKAIKRRVLIKIKMNQENQEYLEQKVQYTSPEIAERSKGHSRILRESKSALEKIDMDLKKLERNPFEKLGETIRGKPKEKSEWYGVVGEMGKKVAKAGYHSILYLYALPILVRKFNNKKGYEDHFMFLIPTSFIWNFMSTCFYLSEVNKYSILPLMPLLTNTISGLYEWYRYEKNKINEGRKEILEKKCSFED